MLSSVIYLILLVDFAGLIHAWNKRLGRWLRIYGSCYTYISKPIFKSLWLQSEEFLKVLKISKLSEGYIKKIGY